MKTATNTEPLHVGFFADGGCYVADPARDCIYVTRTESGRAGAIDEDRAALFAAAPALLEMLRDYVEWHEAAIPKNERDDYETEHLLAGARAAIAAAEAK